MHNYELLKLHHKDNHWVVEYQNDDSLKYKNIQDAFTSLGILSRELSKVSQYPIKILIFDTEHQLYKQSYIFPFVLATDRRSIFGHNLFEKLIK